MTEKAFGPIRTRCGLRTTAAGLSLLAVVCCGATNEIPGRVLYLNMDEIRNGSLVASPATNAIGRATNVRTTPQGKLRAACEFASKNSFIQIADAPSLNPRQLTAALWFRTGKATWVSRTLLEKGMERGYAFVLVGGGKDSPRKGRLRAVIGGREVFSDRPVTGGFWHHAAATYDGQALRLYIDGTLQKQTAGGSGSLAPTACDLSLGMNRSSPSGQGKEAAFDGAIDEVMLFDRALDAPEIKRLMALARPKFTKQQVKRRLKELKDLLDRGLILQDFYDRKAEECEVAE